MVDSEYSESITETTLNTEIDTNTINDGIQKRKRLVKICKDLETFQYAHIFKIIFEDNPKFTENSNGVFINLSNIKDETIDNILDYIVANKQMLVHTTLEPGTAAVQGNTTESDEEKSNVRLSNFEKSIIKKNQYLINQKLQKQKQYYEQYKK